tara:strand:- start:185 stop:697 length:513 start_codon:yes stop_codon:yes gene_type:complete
MVDMEKKVLSEIALYYGDIAMPKGFEINRNKLQEDILKSHIKNIEVPFSREWDKLNTYLREHINLEYGFSLVNKLITGYVYKPNTLSLPKLEIDPVDLRNSPDFIMLYGVNVKDCKVTFFYDDNRRKGRSWTIKLTDNKFIMFPSTQLYYIENNQKDSLNFILTIAYEFN